MANAQTLKAELPMPAVGIALALFAFFCFSVLDAGAKWLVTTGYAVMFVVWIRFAVQAVVIFTANKGWKNARLWAMERPLLHIVRGLSLPAMTMFNFLALRHLQLSETISILLAAPIGIAILAGPILGEWAGPRRWVAIIVGFVGVLIVVRPGIEIISLPVIFSILCMLSNCVYFILTRMLAGSETPESLIFYPGLLGLLAFAPFAYANGEMPAQWSDALIFALVGFAGMIGHMAIIRASALADTSKVTPFMYTQVIYMAGFGYFVFGDLPDVWTAVGTLVISASGLYLWYRERQLRKMAL